MPNLQDDYQPYGLNPVRLITFGTIGHFWLCVVWERARDVTLLKSPSDGFGMNFDSFSGHA